MRHSALTICLASMLSLSACGNKVNQQQLVMSDAQATLTSANNAIADYGIAKGMAQVAETGLTLAGQPAIAIAIGATVAAADTQVAKLKVAVDADTLDLANIQSLVATINAQVQAMRLQAAQSVTVTASSPAATPAQ